MKTAPGFSDSVVVDWWFCWYAEVRNLFYSNYSTLINSRMIRQLPGVVIFSFPCLFFLIWNKRKLLCEVISPLSRNSLIISFLFWRHYEWKHQMFPGQLYMTYLSWSECWSVRWWRACWDCWGPSVWREKCLPWHEWLIFWKTRQKKKTTPDNFELWSWYEAERQREAAGEKMDTSTFTDANFIWRQDPLMTQMMPPSHSKIWPQFKWFYQTNCARKKRGILAWSLVCAIAH